MEEQKQEEKEEEKEKESYLRPKILLWQSSVGNFLD